MGHTVGTICGPAGPAEPGITYKRSPGAVQVQLIGSLGPQQADAHRSRRLQAGCLHQCPVPALRWLPWCPETHHRLPGLRVGCKTGNACAGIGTQAQVPVMAALRCAARDGSVSNGTPAGVGCLQHKTTQLKRLLEQAPAAAGAVQQKAGLQLSKLCSGLILLFLVRRVL